MPLAAPARSAGSSWTRPSTALSFPGWATRASPKAATLWVSYRCRPIGQQSIVLRRPLEIHPVYLDRVRPPLPRCRRAAVDGLGRRRLRQRDVRELLRHPRMRAARTQPVQDTGRGTRWRCSSFIEGFYNPRRRHSSIGYLSPIDYERRHHAATSIPTHTSLPPCSRPSRTSPSGGREKAAVLDRRCARQPHHRAGRDGRMAPPGAEPKNVSKQEGNMPSDQIA